MMECMSTWARFEAEAPEVAAFASRLWPGVIALARSDPVPFGSGSFAVANLATVRRDGAPRITPSARSLPAAICSLPSRTRRRKDMTYGEIPAV